MFSSEMFVDTGLHIALIKGTIRDDDQGISVGETSFFEFFHEFQVFDK